MDWDRVRQAVRVLLPYIMSQNGSTIPQLRLDVTGRRLPDGDGPQLKHADRPVWHRRTALIEELARELKITGWPKRAPADFYGIVDVEIRRLRKSGDLIDWSTRIHSGTFRLKQTHQVQRPSMNLETAATPPEPASKYDDQLMETFLAVITRGRKANTYKFALARALLEYCNSNVTAHHTTDDGTYIIPYSYLADRFLRYYWHQECKFRIKQDFQPDKDPHAIHVIRKVFGDNPGTIFENVDRSDKERAQKDILQKVFGSERAGTSQVVPRFQKVMVGKSAHEKRVFYDYDDDKKIIRLRPEAFEFFRRNNKILSLANLAEWAKFLEKTNGSLPKLVAKIEQNEARRTSLARFREAYLNASMEHCFYCGTRLEHGYIEVDHFLPWTYIFEDEAWNLVLACKRCNQKKSDSLPEAGFQDELIRRNARYRDQIAMLDNSLRVIDTRRGWRGEIADHYDACGRGGWRSIRLP